MDTPGTDCTTELMSVMPRSARSCPLIAVMLIGVVLTVDSRFCAVTVISSSWSPLPGASVAACCAKPELAKARPTIEAEMNPIARIDDCALILSPLSLGNDVAVAVMLQPCATSFDDFSRFKTPF